MDISGVVVACRPEHMETLTASLAELPWADLHFSTPVGRMVVTIEAADHHQSMDRLTAIRRLPRVLRADLAKYRAEATEE
ncbi:MAG: chaperone NapD [Proteobacteria bacterium]|nr:chaperone NapD [Pseudomonadota bacterium]